MARTIKLSDLPPSVRKQIEAAPKSSGPPPQRKGRMNKTEAAYAQLLEGRVLLGEIACFRFEAIKLRLADRTYYTPDFAVWHKGGSIEFHEVKGFWRDDARVKIKVAAEQFPHNRFVAVRKVRGEWDFEWI